MATYEIEYEVIGHHYKTVEVPDGVSIEDIEDDSQCIACCEEYHGDPIEECIIVQINEIKENE